MNLQLIYPEETTTTMTITPEIAKVFLLHNYKKNRKIRKSKVLAYANDMKNHRWDPRASINDAILFDDHGIMKNGQHRCTACIISNEPFETRVIFGIHDPDDTLYQVVDNGCPRRAADVIDIPNANAIASIAKVYIALNEGSAPLISSLQGKLLAEKVSSHVTKSQIVESIEENSDYFQEVLALGRKLSSPFGRARGTFNDIVTLINFVGRGDDLQAFADEFSSDVPNDPTVIACKSYMTRCFCSNTFDTSTRWVIGTILAAYENYRNRTVASCFNKYAIYISRYDKFISETRKKIRR